MHRTPRILAASFVAALLLAGTVACGSSGSDDASGDATPTSAAAGDTTAATDDEASDPTEATGDEGSGGGEQDCAASAESDNLSGDSVVLFAADQDELMESDLTDDDIATIAADGSSMDPSTIEVASGEMFGVRAEEGGSIDAVIIGCAGGQTLVPNVAVGFVITEPGEYPVSLDIAGTELGTIVVS